ncbi:MAG: flagellar motor stator protein MotA [Gammaproteobacteria bacterium]
MLVLIGYLITIFSVFGGFVMSGGHLFALFQPYELLMIAGAALGSFIVANNIKTIKASFSAVFETVKGKEYTKKFHVELLSLFYELTNKIRRDGAISIEGDVENYKNSPLFSKYKLVQRDHKIMEFLCDHLRLIVTGRVDVIHLEEIMAVDIETFEVEAELPISAVNKVADALPAFGIVAAVMGVVHTMESIGLPPNELGALIARALVGTFLGVLLSYGFAAPIAASMENRRQAMIKIMQSIQVVLLASTNNFAPSIAVEMARKVLYADSRPNSKELEDIVKGIKSGGASETNG